MSTQSKPFVFVLMPFSEEFENVYEFGIRQACEAAGASCERADKQDFDDPILQWIYKQIRRADVIVADMSGRNPNVFYEVGYAHAARKRVILLTRNAAEIPFDLQHHQHIIYGGQLRLLQEQLTKKLKWAFDNRMDGATTSDQPAMRRITRILDHISEVVGKQSELQPLLALVLNEMTELLDTEVCSIFLNAPDNPDVIRCVAGSGFAKSIVDIAEYDSGEGFTGIVFQKAETQIIRSTDDPKQRSTSTGWVGKWDEIQWKAYGGVSQFRNCIATPLRIGGRPIGVIKVENKRGGEFTVDDVAMLEAISSGVLSLAIHNARLIQDAERQETRLTKR